MSYNNEIWVYTLDKTKDLRHELVIYQLMFRSVKCVTQSMKKHSVYLEENIKSCNNNLEINLL